MTVQAKQCRGERCRAPIYWLKNVSTGRLAPIDVHPAADGEWEIDLEEGTYEHVRFDEPTGLPRHHNHWFSCVDPPPKRDKQATSFPRRREAADSSSRRPHPTAADA